MGSNNMRQVVRGGGIFFLPFTSPHPLLLSLLALLLLIPLFSYYHSLSPSPPSSRHPVSLFSSLPPQCKKTKGSPSVPALLPSGSQFMFYSPHSGFSNQVGELKNALAIAALLNRTLILPPVLDHHAVALGSCPKFRVQEPHTLRSQVWSHIVDLARSGRCQICPEFSEKAPKGKAYHPSHSWYVAIADVIDLKPIVSRSLVQTIDLRVFASLWCGADIEATCMGPLCKALSGSVPSRGTLESCGDILSMPGLSSGGCVYGVSEDCRTTIWTNNNRDNLSVSMDSNQHLNEVKGKKVRFERLRKDIVQGLGAGGRGEAQVMAFGSLFSAVYKGAQLHVDIDIEKTQDGVTLSRLLRGLSFAPGIVQAGLRYASQEIKRPFFCAQVRMLDGQFKNHRERTLSDLQSRLGKLRDTLESGKELIHLFVMTDLPRSNWTGTLLGELAAASSRYKIHTLMQTHAVVKKAAQELPIHEYGIRSGFYPHRLRVLATRHPAIPSGNSRELKFKPDILLFVEEVVCSCATLGFQGTSGSTISDSIQSLRNANICDPKKTQ